MRKILSLISLLMIISILCGCITDNELNNSKKINDIDKDGVPDSEDAFPLDPSASIDTDNDGYPDKWNENKNHNDSTSTPKLELDDLPYDPNDRKDSDGDYVGDNTDVFPNDPNEQKDTDSDGIGDNSDINPNYNLSILLTIDKFKVTKKLDFFKRAQVYFDIIIDKEYIRFDNKKQYWRVWIDEEKSLDQVSFFYDIPDATDNPYTDIEIIMYDFNLLRPDLIIDISPGSEDTIKLKFDNKENQISYDGFSKGSYATVWYEIKKSNGLPSEEDDFEKTYSWKYDKNQWKLTLKIPIKTYQNYVDLPVVRDPQNEESQINEKMSDFVTSNEKIIIDLANKLQALALSNNYNKIQTINFILSFIQDQNNIKYLLDNESKEIEEYWRFPVETLVDQVGDCEDTSVLFASILNVLDYDVALLYYTWIDENGDYIGHLAVGVNIQGATGDFVKYKNIKYYYCETTTPSYKCGQIPPDPIQLQEDPYKIILI